MSLLQREQAGHWLFHQVNHKAQLSLAASAGGHANFYLVGALPEVIIK